MKTRRLRLGAPISASPMPWYDDRGESMWIALGAGRMHVVTTELRPAPGWPRHASGPLASTPALHNGSLFAGSDDDRLYAFHRDGTSLSGFPFSTGGDVYSSPAIVERKGQTIIVFGSDDGCIYAVDTAGHPLPGWPFQTGDYVSCSPLVFDINGDGSPEVVCGSWNRMLYALDMRGRLLPGWPRELGHFVWSSPAAADIDGDGRPEIVAAADAVYAFRADGSTLPGFPVPTGSYIVSSPALADLDGDGRCEIWIGAEALYGIDGAGTIVLRHDTSAYCWASPIIADLDGDGREEIGIGSWDGIFRVIKPGAGCVDEIRTGGPIFSTGLAADDPSGGSTLAVASWDGYLHAASMPHSVMPASWPMFRRTVTHDAAGEASKRPGYVLTSEAPAEPAGRFAPEGIQIDPERPSAGRPVFVRLLGASAARVGSATLHYLHPTKRLWMRSPAVNDRGLVAIVQPFFEPCVVELYFEGENRDGTNWRYPKDGTYRIEVGRSLDRVRRAARRAIEAAGAFVS